MRNLGLLKRKILDIEEEMGRRQLSLRRNFNRLIGGLGVSIPTASQGEEPLDFTEYVDAHEHLSEEQKEVVLGMRVDDPEDVVEVDVSCRDHRDTTICAIQEHRRSRHVNRISRQGDTVVKRIIPYANRLHNETKREFLNEICMQTIAHGLSNDDVYVPRIMRWGNCHDKEMYLQMEFVHGKTLRRVKEEDGCVSPEIYDKIRRFIATMRENHIRHRDLHAENILVAEDGQKIYIIDWGLAIHSSQMWEKEFRLPRTCGEEKEHTSIV